MKRNHLLIALVALLLMAACAPAARKQPQPKSQELMPGITTVAVLPVQRAESTPQLSEGAEVMDALLAAYFQGRPNAIIVDPAFLESTLSVAGDLRRQTASIGKGVGSDAVLTTTVIRYQERIGSEMSAQQPASVAFQMRLVTTGTGQTIWFASFDETQKTLLENLLKFRQAATRKFKFVTAEQLTREGVADKLNGCPYINPPAAKESAPGK